MKQSIISKQSISYLGILLGALVHIWISEDKTITTIAKTKNGNVVKLPSML
ncbi:MAG: hypothetical protein LC122_13705 [Chitinophagales bacterium]|nr:hypothetical protein [Chitinophagales bacterium]